MAEAYEFSTVGLSCRKALECDYYDVDETVIHGEDWGDDSPQLMKEAQMAKELKLTKKPTKLIRTDKWTLNPTTEQRLLLGETIKVYRRVCRYLVGIVFTHWPELAPLTADERTPAVERLMHATSNRPDVNYPQINRVFHKFPSYYRRAAITFAMGQVSSYMTRYRDWQCGQSRKRRDT